MSEPQTTTTTTEAAKSSAASRPPVQLAREGPAHDGGRGAGERMAGSLGHAHDPTPSSAAALLGRLPGEAAGARRGLVAQLQRERGNAYVGRVLQRVEEYEGVCILASNFGKNIDAAFIRRMRFCVELPFPDEAHRLRIWRGVFPEQAPLDADVDFQFLAHKFKLAGGNIKNVALAAAFNAASNGGTIKMEHLVLALKREYQKLGRACERAEFGAFYELVR